MSSLSLDPAAGRVVTELLPRLRCSGRCWVPQVVMFNFGDWIPPIRYDAEREKVPWGGSGKGTELKTVDSCGGGVLPSIAAVKSYYTVRSESEFPASDAQHLRHSPRCPRVHHQSISVSSVHGAPTPQFVVSIPTSYAPLEASTREERQCDLLG